MFRVITIEREYGCGAGSIAAQLSRQIGWTLWDKRLTDEIARLAEVDPDAVLRCDERRDSRFYRLAKTFWRGSHESSSHLAGQTFDTDRMMSLMEDISARIAREGNAIIVGRGAPYFLRDHPDAFHVFLYAPRSEKIRRLILDGASASDAEVFVESVDRERKAFVKHYFNTDWPTRSLYHCMLNTAIGNDAVIDTLLHTMHRIKQDGRANVTSFDPALTPAS
jgi:cytidylate kinase